jgi:secondary thiamine-phosphate synthase enzyme
MVQQVSFRLSAKRRGFHLITREVQQQLPALPEQGILHLFVKHTSCGITINENADPSVRVDFESISNKLIPELQSYYTHTLEGADDMPAHVKSSLYGCSVSIPITRGRLNLGTWQGIYFCEFRDYGGERDFVATIIG